MVKITTEKYVKKLNLGSNLTSNKIYLQVLHMLNVVLSFCSIYPLVAYFLKKNYSLRQYILKNMRVRDRSLTLVPIGVYLDLIQVGT